MATQHEKAFEEEICDYLAAHGWVYQRHYRGYDRDLALVPDDVFTWLRCTQPEQWAKVVKPSMTPAEQERAKQGILD